MHIDIYLSATPTSAIKQSLDNFQRELHKWGRANQVSFDATKESQHVLSTSDPDGSAFKLLGVPFDTELSMANAVSELVSSAGWKLRTLLRTRRFYTDADLVILVGYAQTAAVGIVLLTGSTVYTELSGISRTSQF